MQYLYLCACYIDLIHSLSNSYTISTRAVWDLLPEPKGGGGSPRAKAINPMWPSKGCGITILKPTMATHVHYYSNVSFNDVICPQL